MAITSSAVLIGALLLSAASEGDSRETKCRAVESEVQIQNDENTSALFRDVAFWIGTGLASGVLLGGGYFLSGMIPIVGLVAGISGLGVSIFGCILSGIIVFDIIDIGSQESPRAAYRDCMANRAAPSKDALAMEY